MVSQSILKIMGGNTDFIVVSYFNIYVIYVMDPDATEIPDWTEADIVGT